MSHDLEKRLTHIEELRDQLENLISVTAQNADKANINLSIRLEEFEKRQVLKDERRWGLFKWVVGASIFLAATVLPINFMYMERINNQVFVNAQRISVLEISDKNQPSKEEMQKLFADEQKTHAEIREFIKVNAEKLSHTVTQNDLSQLKREVTQWFLDHIKEYHKK